jgi:NADH-quinone oxidoreductase subunit J
MMIIIIAILSKSESNTIPLGSGTDVGLIKNLGVTLFNQYVIPFEIGSVLFLTAMICAVVIGKRDTTKSA